MKTANAKRPKVRTVQEWIALRRIELRRIEKQRGRSKPAKLFLVPNRPDGEVRQLELGFDRPKKVK